MGAPDIDSDATLGAHGFSLRADRMEQKRRPIAPPA